MKLGLSPKEIESFSVSRLLRAIAYRDNTEYAKDAQFELDVTEKARDESSLDHQGLVIPDDILGSKLNGKRELSSGVDAQGGFTVDDDLNPSIIEVFRQNNFALNNVMTLTGLKGNVTIPRHSARGTAEWTAENVAPTTTDQGFDTINLSPKHVRTYVDVSRTLLFQNAVGLEQLVRNDIGWALSTAVDSALLYGNGTGNQPTGIAYTNNINNISWDGSTTGDLLGRVLNGEQMLADDNVPLRNTRWLSSISMKRRLKQVQILGANTNQPLWKKNDMMIEYPTAYSTQVTTDHLFFGRWQWAVLATWGGLEIMDNPYIASTQGIIRFEAFQRADIGVLYPQAFAFMGIIPDITYTGTALTWTDGTAITPVQLTATGTPAPMWRLASTSSLPAGVMLSSAGVLSGTPSATQTATDTVFEAYSPAGTDTHTIAITVS